MAKTTADKMRHFASKLFSITGVTDFLLSELANTGSA